MKSILVYGDSLVWGRNASQKDRHSFDDRWPNVLASNLKDVIVCEAGLGGRTTDPTKEVRDLRKEVSELKSLIGQLIDLSKK